jgi:hypothetical protein
VAAADPASPPQWWRIRPPSSSAAVDPASSSAIADPAPSLAVDLAPPLPQRLTRGLNLAAGLGRRLELGRRIDGGGASPRSRPVRPRSRPVWFFLFLFILIDLWRRAKQQPPLIPHLPWPLIGGGCNARLY